MGCKILTMQESSGIGLHWDNLGDNVFPSTNPFTLYDVFAIFAVDIVLYSILLWYLDAIRPGKFGIGRSLYFPFQVRKVSEASMIKKNVIYFQKSYWCGESEGSFGSYSGQENSKSQGEMFQDEPQDLSAGIVVQCLRKVFTPFRKCDVVAVDNVSFKAFGGSITTLLGHNGAGKTTTMNVLTGNFTLSAIFT